MKIKFFIEIWVNFGLIFITALIFYGFMKFMRLLIKDWRK